MKKRGDVSIALIDRYKSAKNVKREESSIESLNRQISLIAEEIEADYSTIGRRVVSGERNPDEENKLIQSVKENQRRLEELNQKKTDSINKLVELREHTRNLNGFITCPKCGKQYPYTSEMVYCNICGDKLGRG